MIPFATDVSVLADDPWWMAPLKGVFVLVFLLLITIFNIVYERKALAKMQNRIGPRMNGPRGWLQTLADGLKLMFKEDFRPAQAEKWVFNLAPYLVAIPAFSVLSMIPFGGQVTIFGEETLLQMTDLPVAILAILGLASVGIYGIVLAGWSSNSTYSLLGGLRSSAQMISYEIAMGLSFVPVFMFAGSMSTSEIVAAQQEPMSFFGAGTGLQVPQWYWLILIPSFVVYVIAMFGETNRLPFDLPESEGELVAGFHTEYSGFRFAMFYLGEYLNMVNVSAIATTLFLGGWHAPWPINLLEGNVVGDVLLNPWFGIVWFTIKLLLLVFLFIWVRASLPRFRYDQFMRLGWKYLIPISLLWISLVAIMRSVSSNSMGVYAIIAIVFTALAVLLFAFFGFEATPDDDEEVEYGDGDDFDPYAGGYPVPPKEGQTLPELATIVSSDAESDAESNDKEK